MAILVEALDGGEHLWKTVPEGGGQLSQGPTAGVHQSMRVFKAGQHEGGCHWSGVAPGQPEGEVGKSRPQRPLEAILRTWFYSEWNGEPLEGFEHRSEI